MQVNAAKKYFQQSIAVLLAGLLLANPVLSQQKGPSPQQQAGKVSALLPSATRNSSPMNVSDPVAWNDLLKTDATGKVRVNLLDGSILSLGINSQLTVVKHDPAT